MIVKRVRLLPESTVQRVHLSLEAPRARRPRTRLDRVRVRSIWLAAEAGDLRTTWGWRPAPDAEADSAPKPQRAPAPPPADLDPSAFLPALRELLRPSPHVLVRREEWPHPLYPYQEEGALFLYERSGALLADEMGLGKTAQALVAAGLLFGTGQIDQVVILCPAALVGHWEREAKLWLPRLADGVSVVAGPGATRHFLWHSTLPVLVAGLETFRSDFQAGRLPERPKDLVILDEAQRIKNADTELAFACDALPRKRSWALTGTPLENRIEELAALLHWVTREPLDGLGASSAVRRLQQVVQLRRTKEGVALDLPPKSVVNVVLEMGEAQRATYDRLESEGILELEERGESIQVTHVLSLLTRLKQVCNVCPATGQSAKLEFLRTQLEELQANGRQALVFSQFTGESSGLRRVAAEIGPEMALYHGGMTQREREEVVREFQAGEHSVLGLSLRAGGVGLNLQKASYVFHFDRWWNPATEWQAEDRAHRHGQTLPVTVYRLVTAGTVEERIHEVLEAKTQLFRELVEGAPDPGRPALTVDELFGILDLRSQRHSRGGF